MELRAAREAKQVRPEMIVVPEDNLTVQELADMLSVESSEIIKSLFFKGVIATVTQTLDMPPSKRWLRNLMFLSFRTMWKRRRRRPSK